MPSRAGAAGALPPLAREVGKEGRRGRGLGKERTQRDGTSGPGHVQALRFGGRWEEEMMTPDRRTPAWLGPLLNQGSGMQPHKDAWSLISLI